MQLRPLEGRCILLFTKNLKRRLWAGNAGAHGFPQFVWNRIGGLAVSQNPFKSKATNPNHQLREGLWAKSIRPWIRRCLRNQLAGVRESSKHLEAHARHHLPASVGSFLIAPFMPQRLSWANVKSKVAFSHSIASEQTASNHAPVNRGNRTTRSSGLSIWF